MVERARPLGKKGRTPIAGARFPSQILAANVAAIRRLRKMGQEDLAERMVGLGHSNWSRITVSDVERGKRGTSVDELFALAMALQTTVVALVDPLNSEGTEDEPQGVDLGFRYPTTTDEGIPFGAEIARLVLLSEDDPWAIQANIGFVWEGNTVRTLFFQMPAGAVERQRQKREAKP